MARDLTKKLSTILRAVARPWRERRMPRAPIFMERKKIDFNFKIANLKSTKYRNPYQTMLVSNLTFLSSIPLGVLLREFHYSVQTDKKSVKKLENPIRKCSV
jgi:hypothetical protein